MFAYCFCDVSTQQPVFINVRLQVQDVVKRVAWESRCHFLVSPAKSEKRQKGLQTVNWTKLFLKRLTLANDFNNAVSSGIVGSKEHCVDNLVRLPHCKLNISLPQCVQESLYTGYKCDEYGLAKDNVNAEFLEST